nr:hypothetical protein PU94_15690 [Coprobacter secundus]
MSGVYDIAEQGIYGGLHEGVAYACQCECYEHVCECVAGEGYEHGGECDDEAEQDAVFPADTVHEQPGGYGQEGKADECHHGEEGCHGLVEPEVFFDVVG